GTPSFGLLFPGGEVKRMLISWMRGKSPKKARKKVRRRPAPLILRTETLEDRAVPSATLVRDINTHTGASLGYSFGDASKSVELNGRLFFFADDGVHGRELWSTDGTDAGTQLVKDINPGLVSSSWSSAAPELACVGDKLIFAADDGVHGSELWVSDGTADGTLMLKDIATQPTVLGGVAYTPASYPMMFHEVNGQVYFVASQTETGQELWV